MAWMLLNYIGVVVAQLTLNVTEEVAMKVRLRSPKVIAVATACALGLAPLAASAAIGQASLFGMGRILGTGAVTAVDGAAGGGINPWAVIAG